MSNANDQPGQYSRSEYERACFGRRAGRSLRSLLAPASRLEAIFNLNYYTYFRLPLEYKNRCRERGKRQRFFVSQFLERGKDTYELFSFLCLWMTTTAAMLANAHSARPPSNNGILLSRPVCGKRAGGRGVGVGVGRETIGLSGL